MNTASVSLIGSLLLLAAVDVGVAQPLSRVAVDGLELEYESRGSGEPVVLVHAGIFADWFSPLLEEPALISRYRVVSYHRVGYAGSGRVAGPVSIADQAAHLRGLLRHLGIRKAHLIGHSSGGNIALQLALDAPEMVHSLVLMEPALPVSTLGQDRMLSTRAFMAPVFEAYRAGDKARAVDGFMRGVSGPGYRTVLDQALPRAFAQGVVDADTFFGQELQPTLSVVGARSTELSPIWGARHEMVLTWLPRAEGYVLPDATHLLHVEHPRAAAEALAAFLSRHPQNP